MDNNRTFIIVLLNKRASPYVLIGIHLHWTSVCCDSIQLLDSDRSWAGDLPGHRSSPPPTEWTAASPPWCPCCGPASLPAPSPWGSPHARSSWSPGRWSPWPRPEPSSPPPQRSWGSDKVPTFSWNPCSERRVGPWTGPSLSHSTPCCPSRSPSLDI